MLHFSAKDVYGVVSIGDVKNGFLKIVSRTSSGIDAPRIVTDRGISKDDIYNLFQNEVFAHNGNLMIRVSK